MYCKYKNIMELPFDKYAPVRNDTTQRFDVAKVESKNPKEIGVPEMNGKQYFDKFSVCSTHANASIKSK